MTEVNNWEGPRYSVSLPLVIYFVIVICLPTKHLGVLMNSFKRVRAFQIELEFESVDFWGEGKTGVPGEKHLNKQQTQPTYGFHGGILTGALLVGGECSHHCARHPCSSSSSSSSSIIIIIIVLLCLTALPRYFHLSASNTICAQPPVVRWGPN